MREGWTERRSIASSRRRAARRAHAGASMCNSASQRSRYTRLPASRLSCGAMPATRPASTTTMRSNAPNGRQSMTDDDERAVARPGAERRQHVALGFDVEVRRRLVDEHEPRVGQHDAGHAETAAARQPTVDGPPRPSARRDRRVARPARPPSRTASSTRRTSSSDALGRAEPHVVAQRGVEDVHLLRNEGQRGARRSASDSRRMSRPSIAMLPSLRIAESADEIEQRALADAARPDDGEVLAGATSSDTSSRTTRSP